MELIILFLAALVLLAILAPRFGADSRKVDPNHPNW